MTTHKKNRSNEPTAIVDVQKRAQALLKQYWGYSAFRTGQWDAISSVVGGRDTFVIFPTGGGKSLCYQLPALLSEGLTLVVSPLIALMQDQVAGLRARGIDAAFINSTLSQREIDQTWTDAEFGRYRLLYVAPERLQTDLFLARAERLPIRLLAVDEAHCVSEWGQHFRPAYRQIGQAREAMGDPPTIAVTATATPEVRRDIMRDLELRDPAVFISGFDRPNITWSIFRTEHKLAKVLDVVRGVPGSGLVYVGTRRHAEQWAARLRENALSAEAYHGGMEAEDRAAVAQRWLDGTTKIVAATNAFGMGIDKPDVRFVVHVDVPLSLESYYQEAGRGGRDGRRSYAVLVCNDADEDLPRRLIDDSHPDRSLVQKVYDTALSLAQVPIGVLPEEPLRIDVQRIVSILDVSRPAVSGAIEVLLRNGIWVQRVRQNGRGLLRFLVSAERLRQYANGCRNAALERFIDLLLRVVNAESFHEWTEVYLPSLARRTGVQEERLARGLEWLQNHGFAGWQPPDQELRIDLVEARTRSVQLDEKTVRQAARRAKRRFEHMRRYARSASCRRRVIMGYFGERIAVPCGACDVCLGRHEALVVTPDDEDILRVLLEQVQKGATLTDLLEKEDVPSHRVETLVDWLVGEDYLSYPELLDESPMLTEKARAFLGRT